MQITSTIVVAVLLVAQTSADRLPSSGNELVIADCIVSAKDHIQLPAESPGVILALETEDGQRVEAGVVVKAKQMIGKLDDEDASARYEAATLEQQVAMAETHKARSAVEAAVATAEVARAELDESHAVNSQIADSVPKTQIRRQQLTVTRAVMEKGVAERDVEVAILTTDLRQAQMTVAGINLKKHRIVSPLDGMIVQLYRKPGEWVSPGDAIARIVRMDTLRVEGFVDASKYLPEDIDGRPVTIVIKRPNRDPEEFTTKISFVSPIVEASGEYRVWAEVENRTARGKHWVLRPGMEAAMRIDLPAAR
ncbi:MAG: hypothetical protein CMJ64_08635 [Planctomycetaceae bacterium]|nr:hypothetical protein [Planctomycetaceae bacterium]